MSRRSRKAPPGWGQGKHRKARVQRFNAKHPERVGKVAASKGKKRRT